ncbi:hypothetical protein SAFG77S_04598 [Streptomyces afghaniensis]
MRDVGVRQQQVLGVTRACQADAVAHRPQLAGPAGGRLARRVHRQRQPAVPPRQFSRQFTGAVRTAVVDEEDLRAPRIVLPEQRRQCVGEHRGLVAGRDDDAHGRPGVRFPARWQSHIRAPEEALTEQQPQPGEE